MGQPCRRGTANWAEGKNEKHFSRAAQQVGNVGEAFSNRASADNGRRQRIFLRLSYQSRIPWVLGPRGGKWLPAVGKPVLDALAEDCR